jgi:hypothetical protein
MTEYELVDSIASMLTILLTWIGLSFTFLTAYLITAYAVGKALTSSQAWTINIFFCLYQTAAVNGVYTSGSRYLEFVQELRAINPERIYSFNVTGLYFVTALFTIVIIVALKFMWDVRHSEKQ